MDMNFLAPSSQYIGQVAPKSGAEWTTVTGACKTGANALSWAVKRMVKGDEKARALLVSKHNTFEPLKVLEATR